MPICLLSIVFRDVVMAPIFNYKFSWTFTPRVCCSSVHLPVFRERQDNRTPDERFYAHLFDYFGYAIRCNTRVTIPLLISSYTALLHWQHKSLATVHSIRSFYELNFYNLSSFCSHTTMKVLTSVFTIVALSLLVVAHGDQARHYARQASSSVIASTMSTPSVTVSLLSANPTAVPLASIVSNEPSAPTQAFTTKEVPGATPSYMPNAPPLPDSTFHTLCPLFFRSSISFNLTTFSIVSNWNAANYPALDLVPPTNSSEVLQWIKDVDNSGIVIPNLQPTNPGSYRTILRLKAVDHSSRWMS